MLREKSTIKGCVSESGTNVKNPRRCRHKRVPNHHFSFEQWNTIRRKSLNLGHLQELRNTTASHRSNTPADRWEEGSHGFSFLPSSWGRETAVWHTGSCSQVSLPTFHGLLLHHTGQWLIPCGYLIPCISYDWKVFLSEVLFPSVISSLSWRQWQPKITMETTALLARTQEDNLCSSQQENKTCLVY